MLVHSVERKEFSATKILREINFGNFKSSDSEFWFFENVSIQKIHNFSKIQSRIYNEYLIKMPGLL